MINFTSKKSRLIFSRIIVAILVISMLVSIIASLR